MIIIITASFNTRIRKEPKKLKKTKKYNSDLF